MLRYQDLCGHVMVRRGEAFWLWTVLAATCTHDIGSVLPVEALVVILNLIPEILLFLVRIRERWIYTYRCWDRLGIFLVFVLLCSIG